VLLKPGTPLVNSGGVERLLRTVEAAENRTPIKLSSEIVEAVDAFSCGVAQHDDLALVILRVV
jgi:serine phosphatase RsbU (regulator of sigma subunit)